MLNLPPCLGNVPSPILENCERSAQRIVEITNEAFAVAYPSFNAADPYWRDVVRGTLLLAVEKQPRGTT